MPIDPQIPLQVKQFHVPTAQEMMSLQDLATKNQLGQVNLADKQRESQNRNMLLDILQNPQSTDPATGRLTPQALAGITRLDPEKGIALEHQQRNLTLQDMQFNEKKMAIARNIEEAYVSSYDRALQTTGGNKEEARKIAMQDRQETIAEQEKNGMFRSAGFSPQEIERARGLTRDPEQVRHMVTAMGGKIASPQKSESDIGKLGDDLAAGRITKSEYDQKKAQLLVDPVKMEQTARAIAELRQAPLGSFAMKTPQGMNMMARVMELNPDYQATDYTTRQKGEKDFATGKQGNTIRSFNVALEHLNTLDRLSDALNNKDVQLINKIGNMVATQTGKPAPTEFAAAKKIVADEIVKAIVGSGGGVTDREEAAKTVSAANSPAQLKGVINTYKELMSGQLVGLKQQYEGLPGQKRPFEERFLSGTAKEVVRTGKVGATGGVKTISTDEEYDALPSGAIFKGPDGKTRKKP